MKINEPNKIYTGLSIKYVTAIFILVFVFIPYVFISAKEFLDLKPVEFCSTIYMLSLNVHSDLELNGNIRNSPIDRANYLDAVLDLGVRHIREEIMNWELIQPTRNSVYQFDITDDFVTKASERGISIMALFYWLPSWVTLENESPEIYPKHGAELLPKRKYEVDFRRFIRAVVRRYCGRYPESIHLKYPIHEWVFMNEPEYSPINEEPENYAFWLKIFYEEIKNLDPQATIIAPAITCNQCFEKRFLTRLLACENLKGPNYPYFDVCDFHAYPQWPTHYPNDELMTYDKSFAHVAKVLAEYNVKVPIWLTETGYMCPNTDKQARQMVKNLVHAATIGVDRVYQFGLWDGGHERGYWGFLEDTPSGQVPVRKPYFYAYQTLIDKIGCNQGIRRIWPGIYEALLPDDKKIYVMWNESETFDPVSLITGLIRITNIQGREILMSIKDLKLSDEPYFIEEI